MLEWRAHARTVCGKLKVHLSKSGIINIIHCCNPSGNKNRENRKTRLVAVLSQVGGARNLVLHSMTCAMTSLLSVTYRRLSLNSVDSKYERTWHPLKIQAYRVQIFGLKENLHLVRTCRNLLIHWTLVKFWNHPGRRFNLLSRSELWRFCWRRQGE